MLAKRDSDESGSRSLAASPKRSFWEKSTGWILSYLRPSGKVEEPLQDPHDEEGSEPSELEVTYDQPKDYTIQSVETVSRNDLTVHDIIVILVGPTGAGKSAFIQTATGLEAGVNTSLDPGAGSISAVRATRSDGVRVVFVDTPGFLTDAYQYDRDVLDAVVEWLQVGDDRQDKLKVSGILYLRRISQNNMKEANYPPLSNTTLFWRLCGENVFGKIILTTWPEDIDEETYNEKEKELRKTYWEAMIHRGSLVRRLGNTFSSNWGIVDVIVGRLTRRWVGIRKELADLDESLPTIKVGYQFRGTLESIKEQKNGLLGRIEGLEEATQVQPALLNELDELWKKRNKLIADMQQSNSLFGRLKQGYLKAGRLIRCRLIYL
ncbi:hypothetical protein P691DRAFT_711423 [Macrolepiota fuliginosa MF-IS2]|uniref:G domain-containing protein n=1 Tax=Macrolepiota fuliginosa MF-IS2 TaxID=1400762 RepID=A0A9P6BYW7_9AGAR|nr:hypothetical protein P691DRAFT_711423 [Macrolepiota fuliginosa MF-IS2]